jgi:hypothetical protein
MKKTHKLLILLALVCTLLVCGMMSASAAKEIEFEGRTCYTDDDEKYIFNDRSCKKLIGVTENFNNTGWEFCGVYGVDNETVYATYFGEFHTEPSIYPLKTFRKFSIVANNECDTDNPLYGQMIFKNAFALMSVEDVFYIPYSVTAIDDSAFAFTSVGSFSVDKNNKYYYNDENGILYGRWNQLGELTGYDYVVMSPNKTVDHIDIPNNVTEIYSYAYYYYKAKTINIPTSVESVGAFAFPCLALGSTDKFDAVYYEGTIDQWNKITIEDSNGRITKAHLYCNDWYNISEQTCTTAEIQRRDCHCSEDCTAYETRETKPSLGGHNFTEQLGAVRSTCSTQGYIEYYCSNCGNVKVYEPLEADNHEGPYEDCSEYIAPTCCTEGLEANKRCSACKVQTYTGTTISATGNHIYGDWYATEAPTCCQEGVERRDCTVGEAYETRVATPTGNHSFGDWYVTLEPTCAITGIERRDCTLGEAFETRDIPVSDIHTYGNNWEIYEPATCAAVGTEISYCTVCFGAPITREIPKTDDHSWRNWANVIVATCTTSGTEERVCNRCKATESRETEIVDHRFNGGAEVITEPTCRKNGTKEVKCIWYDQCGETELKQIRAVNHTYENYEVTTPATCINTGIETAKCKWYDECYTTRSNTIPATGTHIFDKPYKSLRGQCDKEGYIKYKCTADPDCTEIKTETLAVDPEFHNSGYNFDVNKKDATCCEDGYSGDTICIGCGVVVVKGEVIPATGEHVFRTEEREGNCVSKGEIIYICSLSNLRIKSVDTVFVPDNHGTLKTVNQKVPTCQSKGYTGDKQCVQCKKIVEKGNETSYGKHDIRTNGKCHVCGTAACTHMCHKNDGKGTGWYRFCLFFWKLFKMNKTCSCGMYHY